MSRRALLRAIPCGGAALLLYNRLPAIASVAAAGAESFEPNLFLSFDMSGAVRLTLRKVEMGQGAHQGLRTLAAEELDLSPDTVTVVQSDSDPRYRQILTGGSFSLAAGWRHLRPAAAMARHLLVASAAERWGTDPATLTTADGHVRHPDGRSLSYGSLVPDAAARPIPPPESVPLKPTAHFNRVGRRSDPDPYQARIAAGAGLYGIDRRLPGMLYASIERAPRAGAAVAAFMAEDARRIQGVVDIIPLKGTPFPSHDYVRSGVAVLAEDSWAAQRGRAALRITWTEGAGAGFDSDAWRERLRRRAEEPGTPCRTAGAQAAPTADLPVLTATYDFPYVAHAPLEPPNALAWVRDRHCEVWTGTQRQRRLHDALVRELGLPQEAVRVHSPLVGGGFGRRLEVEYGIEAALLSQQVGRPVQVLWTREDDMTLAPHRAASVHAVSGWLDADGRIGGMTHRYVGDSVFAQQEPDRLGTDGYDFSMAMPLSCFGYDVKNLRFEHVAMQSPVPVGWWRGTGSTTAAVANECFVDEMAVLAGADPLEFRLRHLPPGHISRADYRAGFDVVVEADLMRRVLLAAAERTGWTGAADQAIACGYYDCPSTYTAVVAELETAGARPRVKRLVIATDCGLVVNPDQVEKQLHSNAVFALGSVFGQRMTLADGRVQQRDFVDFPLPRLSDMPRIETVLLPSDRPPSGIGEPATPVVTAAIMNALSRHAGSPIRALPV